jgi:hypothetical protein
MWKRIINETTEYVRNEAPVVIAAARGAAPYAAKKFMEEFWKRYRGNDGNKESRRES